MNVGDGVRVNRHWLRGRHTGTLLDYDGTRVNQWLVGFDVQGVGLGFTDPEYPEHQCLRLPEDCLAPL